MENSTIDDALPETSSTTLRFDLIDRILITSLSVGGLTAILSIIFLILYHRKVQSDIKRKQLSDHSPPNPVIKEREVTYEPFFMPAPPRANRFATLPSHYKPQQYFYSTGGKQDQLHFSPQVQRSLSWHIRPAYTTPITLPNSPLMQEESQFAQQPDGTLTQIQMPSVRHNNSPAIREIFGSTIANSDLPSPFFNVPHSAASYPEEYPQHFDDMVFTTQQVSRETDII